MSTDWSALRASDLELARRVLGGEREAQRAFFEAHRARVHLVLFRILGSNRDIDDLIQDAFLQIFRSLPSYRGDARLGTWIDRICVRVAYHFLSDRKRRRAPSLELVRNDDDQSPTDRRAEAREATRRLYLFLENVDREQRTAFVLHVLDGRSIGEVAAVTGASGIATKLRIWRLRKRIEEAAHRDPVLALFAGAEGGSS